MYLSVSAPVCLYLSAYLSVCVHLYLYQHGLCLLQKPPYLPGHHTEHRHCEYLCLSLSLYLSVYLSVFTHPCTTLPYQHCLYKAHPIFQNIMRDLDCVSLSVCVYTCLSVCVAVCVHPTWSTLLYQRGLYRACLTFQIIIQDNYKLCESLCTCLYTCLCSPHLVYTAVPAWPLQGLPHLP